MSIFVGSQEIQDLKIGTTDVNEVYVGSQQVWTRGTPAVDTGWMLPNYDRSGGQFGTGWASPEAVWNNFDTQYSRFNTFNNSESGWNYAYLPAFPANVSNILEWGVWFKIEAIEPGEDVDFRIEEALDGSPRPAAFNDLTWRLARVFDQHTSYILKDENLVGAPSEPAGVTYFGDWTAFLGNAPDLLAWLRGGAGLRVTTDQEWDAFPATRFYSYRMRFLYETT